VSLDNAKLRLVDSFDEAMELKRWLSTVDTKLAVDTEGTGLNPNRDHVRTVQVGRRNVGWVIPIDWPGSWGAFAKEVLSSWEGEFVMHNAPYDHAMLKSTFGLDLPRHKIHNTLLMAHVLDSMGSLALKNLAVKHVDPRAKVGQEALSEALGSKGGWTWATIPINYERYWAYAALDTVLTDQLDDVLRPLVMADAPRSYELELAASWVYARMQHFGVMLDRPYAEQFSTEMAGYVREVEEWCLRHYGIKPGSNDAVVAALQRDGIEFTKLTPSGKWCLDKEVLEGIDHPLARSVLGRRRVDKMHGYVTGYIGFADEDDIVHPNINSVGGSAKNEFEPGGEKGVRTGRSSIDRPSVQNSPVRTTAGKRVRKCWRARPDRVWVKTDLDQIEMRMLAHESQDLGMIQAFHEPGDFFVNMARVLFDEPTFQKSDPRRQYVKNSGYAKAYGSGPEQFARTAGATLEQAIAFMGLFDRTYPDVQRYVKRIEREGKERLEAEGFAYTRSSLTNRRLVADDWRIYALNNYRIQGEAGEVLKRKAIEMDQAGLGQYLLFPVHDEFDLDVPQEDLSDVLVTVKDIMNDPDLLTVPITSSVEVGPNWGECVAV
jgi:DNA polymerase I